ncbi:MAG TPA: DUF1269 domain-containing protein [Salinisphaeraceae bacterium]|nr:DUF1269 domain-containing protein [Salinisphaeraceae bacterium]
MAELVVIGYENIQDADRVLTDLRRLEKEYLIDLEDAVVAIRQPNGKVNLKQSVNLAGPGAAYGGLGGALWGTLVGLLFLNPLAGLVLGGAVGAGGGALSGSLQDYGINDDFMRGLSGTLQSDSSALFLLIRKAQPDKVLNEISHFGGKILRTSLSPEQEAELGAALQKSSATVREQGSTTSAASSADTNDD